LTQRVEFLNGKDHIVPLGVPNLLIKRELSWGINGRMNFVLQLKAH